MKFNKGIKTAVIFFYLFFTFLLYTQPIPNALEFTTTTEKAIVKLPIKDWHHKLNPATRLTLARASSANFQLNTLKRIPIQTIFSLAYNSANKLSVDALILVQAGTTIEQLNQIGITCRGQVGNIIIARIPITLFSRLAKQSCVQKIEISQINEPQLDLSRVEIGIDRIHRGIDLPRAFLGEGVIIGFVDSGIDFNFPDFSNENGTRIQYLLELAEDGAQTAWTKDQIDSAPTTITQQDGDGSHGHGTHIAGIAAGGGRVNPDFMGMAPKSDIIFVKGIRDPDSDGGFADADVVIGCQYIFQNAQALGKPVVINLSLGGATGPHDGTSLYEKILSDMTGPGKIIVAANGNEGNLPIHAGKTVQTNQLYEIFMIPDQSKDIELINMWYSQATISEVAVAVLTQQNGTFERVATSAFYQTSNSQIEFDFESQGEIFGHILMVSGSNQHPASDENTLILIDNNDNSQINFTDWVWSIMFKSSTSGEVDVWVANGGTFHTEQVQIENTNFITGDSEQTTSTPSTAKKVISVGSYLSKRTWTDLDNVPRQWMNPDPDNPGSVITPQVGQISYFSAKGPTRDGRITPDISAPGEIIFSALSSFLTEGIGFERALLLDGGKYVGQQGSSMSAPHVTGLVALMLEADPTLDYSQTLNILKSTARVDQYSGNVPNNRIGSGKIDAYAALKTVAGAENSTMLVNPHELTITARPGGSGTSSFKISNTGNNSLKFLISVVGNSTLAFLPVKKTLYQAKSIFSNNPAGNLPTTLDNPVELQQKEFEPANFSSKTIEDKITAKLSAQTAGDDILVIDDGDAFPDAFLGWQGGTVGFTWANEFNLNGFGFQLESVLFFMQSQDISSNDVTVAVHDQAFNLLQSTNISLSPSQNGEWFKASLKNPISFQNGQTFYLKIQANAAIQYPAGIDQQAQVPNKSYAVNPNSQQLIPINASGFENGAFLIRAQGTKITVENALTVEPAAGTIAANGTESISVFLNAQNLAEGDYQAELKILSSNGNLRIPVSINVNKSNSVTLSDVFELEQNYPNPFNSSTMIPFFLKETGKVKLEIFDVLGRLVSTLIEAEMTPARYTTIFKAPNLPAGIYFYRLQVGSSSEARRLVLLR